MRPEVADALVGLLTKQVTPFVPDRGSVGMADLALNAAVAQVVIGEGAVLTDDGEVISGAEALANAGLVPLELETHEALSLLNTNTFTLGSAVLADPRLEGSSRSPTASSRSRSRPPARTAHPATSARTRARCSTTSRAAARGVPRS